MGEVVQFHHGGKTYRPEFVLLEGYKRRQWVVIERQPDGTETFFGVWRGRHSEAFAMADLYTKIEARNRRDIEALERNPLGRAVLDMGPEQRAWLIQFLAGVERMAEGRSV